jgi:hypothetical protein
LSTRRLIIFVWKVEDTQFKVHKHFLCTYSSVFRDLLRPQHNNSNNGNTRSPKNGGAIYLDGVTVLEFESLLTFFYERYVDCVVTALDRIFRLRQFCFV